MPSPSSTLRAQVVLAADTQGISKAAQFIKEGKLVVLPTETVYGIAVNLHSDEARTRAKELKGASSPTGHSAPWVVHVSQADDALSWAPNISKLGRRLITKALPGPVAFQVKLAPADLEAARSRLGAAADQTLHDGFLTIRCPEFSATQQILADAAMPVAIIGAGTPAQPAIFEVADLPDSLLNPAGGQSAIVAAVDGGPTRYRRSSTLVRIEGERFSVVRAGVIDERIIQRMADFVILFICSGNTCRSPMAAALATRILADRLRIEPSELPLRHVVVQSAGLHAMRGARATFEAMDAVKSHKADLGSHISQPATTDLLRRADLIYTMTEAHRDEVLDLWPAAAAKTQLVDSEGDIDDPIGQGLPVYERVASHLYDLLKNRLSELPL